VARAVSQLPRGSGAARLAVMRDALDGDVLAVLQERAARLGFPVIVRSSSPLEDDPVWSGAFSSFLDVTAGDLATAVRGCWASAFAVDPLGRAQRAGVAPGDLAMAVLVQPQVAPDTGGLARAAGDGEVTITAIAGSPAPLLAGWERGVQIRVDAADRVVSQDPGSAVVARETALAVAELARRVRSRLGGDAIEWASAGGQVTLLQWRRAASVTPAAPEVPGGLDEPMALRLARLALRYPGDMGERLIVPWACAAGWREPGAGVSEPAGGDPEALLREAERRASGLVAVAWGLPDDEARDTAARTLAEARGPAPRDALRRLADLRPVPAEEASAVLRLVSAATRRAPAAAPVRHGWEPFVYGAVRAHGERLDGVPASPGIGAGAVVTVTNPHTAQIGERRPVLTASRPLPGLAPLMWGAAGLVTGAGSPAAHLLEVAHSLRLPAVVGCPLDERVAAAGARRMIAAVDGTEGAVFLVTG
jgi:hypothetical protein